MFEEKVASKRSLSMRRLVYGAGVNDAWYVTQYKSKEGKSFKCPYYIRWKSMLQRCYSSKYQEKYPTYLGCTTSKEWLLFSNFRKWMEKQDWVGKQLDKDILILSNKVYSKGTCMFVSEGINKLLTDRGALRGKYPQGVCWHKDVKKYVAQCMVRGKQKHLGYFATEREAECVYCKFKEGLILQASNGYEASSQPRLQEGLQRHSKWFKDKASKLRH